MTIDYKLLLQLSFMFCSKIYRAVLQLLFSIYAEYFVWIPGYEMNTDLCRM